MNASVNGTPSALGKSSHQLPSNTGIHHKSQFLKFVGNDPCFGDMVLALGIGKPHRQRAELALRLSVEKV